MDLSASNPDKIMHNGKYKKETENRFDRIQFQISFNGKKKVFWQVAEKNVF